MSPDADKEPDFDKVFSSLPDGWLTRDEAELLWHSARLTAGPILEVGCYKGRSTRLLAALGRPVHCVDPFEGFDTDDPTGQKTLAAWRRNAGKFVNVVLWRQRVETWVGERVGFAYLDGDHTYEGTVAQILKATECGAGVIAVHDVNDTGGGVEVRRACLDELGQWDRRVGRLAVWDLRGE